MIYFLLPPIAVFALFLPLILHRIHLYRNWADQERRENRKPSVVRFSNDWDRWRDPFVFFKDRKNKAIAIAWLAAMVFPFHQVF